MRILGIDPGTATTGYGIVESDGHSLKALEFGCLTTAKASPLPERLEEIYKDLTSLIKKYRPNIMTVESVYFYNNVKTAIAVAQARGVVLLCAHQNKIPVREFTPLQVKSNLTNYGKAEKKQVQQMVKTLLKLNRIPKPDDAADALALAICGANQNYDQ
ncbi:MAG: crossover junction endodeoxyribonuclease RuvC [Candidatus Doudnabacteria bacterium RIFCSPHIGHO2_02_FULL_48_21]|uniref:Crossover junction endodeoxyribonuclease RuvC n=1 Tax=Candidatus Doudnabacteria bacterium RIFCSPLOWO2_02_FULL_48_13 TaxID=1817845 RepID=A0A1F5QCC7_9BACT|nr:MAG: crossover junction endodeoxyribonuclease RuvC [Candidatus Doudnabacteria bacterium RIFCSPHIGHO2_01_48_18]OGE79692.1 MAG: crossover junction endodeoxyribonuclease RuvC [Candidatus Doudnabacteria bacterium RIFCSPHIGHO2_01_FULL_48_180]OGE91493.1 MAG: crossover junction endodeoxyribonuclease RuvC [Candidatus Doudnabacteria bacterium RIFCSPHIGHO2_12_FULL_47_25]OGE93107.1 MAG: crossover junction endodeoxyribonuclease RuvC [Candidatus Doudnabacteria bacterium RIFCSPHIGHO2_02_FULL_48_21]OGE9811